MINTLIFGSSGFVGSYLLVELNKDVLAIDIDDSFENKFLDMGIPFLKLDIRKEENFRKISIDSVKAVINVASLQPSRVSEDKFDPRDYILTNTIGILNILKYCIQNNIKKFIHLVSHQSVVNNIGIQTENSPYNINYKSSFAEFCISEVAAIELIKCYTEKSDLQCIILRIPNVVGYGSHIEGFRDGKYEQTGSSIFINNAINGKPIEIFGDPFIGRDNVYVKDVVSAIIKSLYSDTAKGLYNISSGRMLSLQEQVIKTIEVFAEHPCQIIYRKDQKNKIEPCLYDITKAETELGWNPQYADYSDMLRDYKKEMESGYFNFLIGERRNLWGH